MREEGENHTRAYELVDGKLFPRTTEYDDNYLVFNGITLRDDEYVNLHFNDTVYYAGTAHPYLLHTRDDFHCHWRRSHPEEVLGRLGTRSGQQALIEEETKSLNADYGLHHREGTVLSLSHLQFLCRRDSGFSVKEPD